MTPTFSTCFLSGPNWGISGFALHLSNTRSSDLPWHLSLQLLGSSPLGQAEICPLWALGLSDFPELCLRVSNTNPHLFLSWTWFLLCLVLQSAVDNQCPFHGLEVRLGPFTERDWVDCYCPGRLSYWPKPSVLAWQWWKLQERSTFGMVTCWTEVKWPVASETAPDMLSFPLHCCLEKSHFAGFLRVSSKKPSLLTPFTYHDNYVCSHLCS